MIKLSAYISKWQLLPRHGNIQGIQGFSKGLPIYAGILLQLLSEKAAAVILLAKCIFRQDHAEAAAYNVREQQSTFYVCLHVLTQTHRMGLSAGEQEKFKECTFCPAAALDRPTLIFLNWVILNRNTKTTFAASLTVIY